MEKIRPGYKFITKNGEKMTVLYSIGAVGKGSERWVCENSSGSKSIVTEWAALACRRW